MGSKIIYIPGEVGQEKQDDIITLVKSINDNRKHYNCEYVRALKELKLLHTNTNK